MPEVYYDSTLTGQELDEALKKIPLIDKAVEDAQKSAKTAESWAQGDTSTREGEDEDNAEYWAGQAKTSASTASTGAQVITDNQEALDAVKDNIEAIRSAADNAARAETAATAAESDADRAEAAAKQAQAIAQGQKGYFEDPDALQKAVPEGEDGDWAIVGTTDTIWIWDADTGKWTNSGQNIDLSNYYQKKEVDDALAKKQDKLTLPLKPNQGGTGSNFGQFAAHAINGTWCWLRISNTADADDERYYYEIARATGRPRLDIKNDIIGSVIDELYTKKFPPTPADIGAQEKLTGTAGQVVGFGKAGAPVPAYIGGRNLATKQVYESNILVANAGKDPKRQTISDSTVPSGEAVKINFTTTMAGTTNGLYFNLGALKNKLNDEAYTVTFYVKSNKEYLITNNYIPSDVDYVNEPDRITTTWQKVIWAFNATPRYGYPYVYVEADVDEQMEFYVSSIKIERGSFPTDWTPALEDLQEKPTDGVLVPVYPNAGAHNSIYRGKNIQDKYSSGALYTAIENGTFEDLFIGDYFDITINTSFMASEKVRCLLAGFDVFWGCGDQVLNKHHAVIVPMNCFAAVAGMNSGGGTTGSYTGSEMHKTTLPVYATALRDVFNTHLLKNREFVGSVMTATTPSMAGLGWNGATTTAVWEDCELRLMSDVEVYGCAVFSSSAYDVGTAKSRLPLFTLAPNHIVCGLGGNNYASKTARFSWWLSGVVSNNLFTSVHGSGDCSCNAAVNEIGVRPRWLIG